MAKKYNFIKAKQSTVTPGSASQQKRYDTKAALNGSFSSLSPADQQLRQARMLSRHSSCMLTREVWYPLAHKWRLLALPCNNPRDSDCRGHCQETRIKADTYALRALCLHSRFYMTLIPFVKGRAWNAQLRYWGRHGIHFEQWPLIANQRLILLNEIDPRLPQLQETPIEEIINLLPTIYSNVAFDERITGNLFPAADIDDAKSACVKVTSVSSDAPEYVRAIVRQEAAAIQIRDPRTMDEFREITKAVAERYCSLLRDRGITSVKTNWVYVEAPLFSEIDDKEALTLLFQPYMQPLVWAASP